MYVVYSFYPESPDHLAGWLNKMKTEERLDFIAVDGRFYIFRKSLVGRSQPL